MNHCDNRGKANLDKGKENSKILNHAKQDKPQTTQYVVMCNSLVIDTHIRLHSKQEMALNFTFMSLFNRFLSRK